MPMIREGPATAQESIATGNDPVRGRPNDAFQEHQQLSPCPSVRHRRRSIAWVAVSNRLPSHSDLPTRTAMARCHSRSNRVPQPSLLALSQCLAQGSVSLSPPGKHRDLWLRTDQLRWVTLPARPTSDPMRSGAGSCRCERGGLATAGLLNHSGISQCP